MEKSLRLGVVMKNSSLALSLLLTLFCAASFAQVPQKISYQGLLTTTSGTPVTDGSYTLQFDIYDSLAGGTSLWTETQTGVAVQRGTFSVVLGSVTPINLAFTKTDWVRSEERRVGKECRL